MSSDPLSAFLRAKEILGTEAAIAQLVGVTQPTINYAFKKGMAQAEWCIPIERATGGKVTRHQLRPDLYPNDEVAA
jgi:DNA-binding transcriptional regulator YdaS (Cro superfamily)